MTYEILRVDGTREPFTPKGKRASLEEMQRVVGGYIERVTIHGGEMWLNEDGLGLYLPVNPEASRLMRERHGYGIIVGDVLLAMRKKRGD